MRRDIVRGNPRRRAPIQARLHSETSSVSNVVVKDPVHPTVRGPGRLLIPIVWPASIRYSRIDDEAQGERRVLCRDITWTHHNRQIKPGHLEVPESALEFVDRSLHVTAVKLGRMLTTQLSPVGGSPAMARPGFW